jgi:hypothetical protein
MRLPAPATATKNYASFLSRAGGQNSIAYRYEDLPQEGAVRIVTTNARAQEAVHAFLTYEITEHQTGESIRRVIRQK